MKLYKYLSFDSGKRLLQHGCARFTPPTDFNDPFELNPSFDLLSQADYNQLPDDPDCPGQKLLNQETLAPMFAALGPGIQKAMAQHAGQIGQFALRNNDIAQFTLDRTYGILCLTEVPDSLLMWAHYGDNHKGIAIQFNSEHPYLASAQQPNNGRVEYSNDRPVLSYSNLHSPELFFRKSSEWAYEREWRFVKPLSEADKILEAEPSPIHLFGLPPDLITGVVIGVGVPHGKRVELMQLCGSPPLEHVTIYQTRLSDKTYELEVHPPVDGSTNQVVISGEICGGRGPDGLIDPSVPSLMLMFVPAADLGLVAEQSVSSSENESGVTMSVQQTPNSIRHPGLDPGSS